ncbi:E3 ubiquitin-protein ligase RNF25-like isoform X2 [Oppia nitens]|uniref:E3 ubiquitin-protein ligase RNF25-like isoform X2 n=1 Tax=Oppia nitens TaxID=1686743 RepID=UPI0023DBDA52|nr:E3 ubiquitin-protein ligase RNF25-like isoform X2 [Oppia nitens]
MNNCLNETLATELEVIKAIYLDDINIDTNDTNCDDRLATVSIDILPKTAGNSNNQLVRFTLFVVIAINYPNECPSIEMKNTRGLTDDDIQRIAISNVCQQRIADTMIYEIIEKSRDVLTTLNCPVGTRCAICLYDFTTDDQIMRNDCFHHFHCRCFADYVSKQIKSETNVNLTEVRIHCPICRNLLNNSHINDYTDPNKYSNPCLLNEPLVGENDLIEEAKINVNKFKDIYEKQLKNGGIIDVESERNKYFIRISETTQPNND